MRQTDSARIWGQEGWGCQDSQVLIQTGHLWRERNSYTEIIFVSAVKKSFGPYGQPVETSFLKSVLTQA